MTKIYDIVSLSHNELLNSTWSLVSIYIYVYIYIYISEKWLLKVNPNDIFLRSGITCILNNNLSTCTPFSHTEFEKKTPRSETDLAF